MNTFVAISVLAGLMSLPALAVAWRRCAKQKSILAVGMLLVLLFVTATFFSSAFRAPLFVDYITASSYQLPSGPFYACYLLAAIIVDLLAYLLARRLTGSNLWRW
ncbi:MAG: hypothetical protein J1E63_09625, partial [Muribaculaceae bacterium]|nr:hypothetical protein [Muribaculaceae bacterium]